jgi:hypothetical protein
LTKDDDDDVPGSRETPGGMTPIDITYEGS